MAADGAASGASLGGASLLAGERSVEEPQGMGSPEEAADEPAGEADEEAAAVAAAAEMAVAVRLGGSVASSAEPAADDALAEAAGELAAMGWAADAWVPSSSGGEGWRCGGESRCSSASSIRRWLGGMVRSGWRTGSSLWR